MFLDAAFPFFFN